MNTLSSGMQDLTGLGAPFKPIGAAGNGLLTGLTEAWKPDATLAMIGQKAGLNTGTSVLFTYEDQAGFPGGKCLQVNNNSDLINTATSALIEAIGLTDFCYVYWMYRVAGTTGRVGVFLGENNNSGFDIQETSGGLPNNPLFEIPGSDGSYPFVATTGNPETANTPHLIAVWWIASTKTLNVSVDNGTGFNAISPVSAGSADPTNTMNFRINCAGGIGQFGPSYLWQGTAGVANAVSQLANLYGSKLQYSDFT